VLEEAVAARRVVRLVYADRSGATTERDVEPVSFTAGTSCWYFLGWCRLRGDGRVFRIDRILRAALLDEPAPDRSFEEFKNDLPSDLVARSLDLV
jgi:predicted DNA-binding transcriptional regulator YafY